MLTHLDKFIKKYVLCKNCNYPELKRFVDGKDLKSVCNACGHTGTHDALHKAGKEIMKNIKAEKKVVTDI
jgi:translation initiation factor 5